MNLSSNYKINFLLLMKNYFFRDFQYWSFASMIVSIAISRLVNLTGGGALLMIRIGGDAVKTCFGGASDITNRNVLYPSI